MIGKCALYDTETDLKRSHIIPKFAFDYMKKTGSSYLRTYENPNKRMQDGPKEYLLSEKAEQEFSKREHWFANRIFLPYLKDNAKEFIYDDNFAYFTISVLWRVLLDQLKQPSVKGEEKLKFLNNVQNEWKQFLKELTFPRNYNDLNIFLTDRITSHDTQGINVDLYLSRIIDATIIHNEDYTTVAVYVKFLRFMFWSVVKGTPNDCAAIKINFIKGTLKVPQKVRDNFFGGFLQHRISIIDKRPKPSPAQQRKIADELAKKDIDFWNSDAGKSLINDYKNKPNP